MNDKTFAALAEAVRLLKIEEDRSGRIDPNTWCKSSHCDNRVAEGEIFCHYCLLTTADGLVIEAAKALVGHVSVNLPEHLPQ